MARDGLGLLAGGWLGPLAQSAAIFFKLVSRMEKHRKINLPDSKNNKVNFPRLLKNESNKMNFSLGQKNEILKTRIFPYPNKMQITPTKPMIPFFQNLRE